MCCSFWRFQSTPANLSLPYSGRLGARLPTVRVERDPVRELLHRRLIPTGGEGDQGEGHDTGRRKQDGIQQRLKCEFKTEQQPAAPPSVIILTKPYQLVVSKRVSKSLK